MSEKKPKKKRLKRMMWCGVIFLVICMLGYALFEPYWLQIDHSTRMVDNLPAELEGFRIVFLSDIHAGKRYNNERLRALVDTANSMKPDIVLLGGDFSENKEDFFTAMEELSKLRSELGVFAVRGNHDTYLDAEAFSRALRENGITPCENSAFKLSRQDKNIYIGGI